MSFATIFFYVITYFRIVKIIFKCYNNFATYLRYFIYLEGNMERDYGKEIDEIKKDIAEIKAMLTNEGKKSRETTLGDEVGHVKRMNNMHPNENIMKLMHDCETVCGEKNLSGCITYLGVFASGGRQSSWVRSEDNTDELLALAENGNAENMLSCIGSREKLGIITALLRRPMTAAELTEELGFGTSGQTYHHLRTLVMAKIVEEERKGRYIVAASKVQGIIMILAGIRDLFGDDDED